MCSGFLWEYEDVIYITEYSKALYKVYSVCSVFNVNKKCCIKMGNLRENSFYMNAK